MAALLASADMSALSHRQAAADRASISDNYVFALKAEWIKPGMKVNIVANPDGLASDPTPANNSADLAPAVNPAAVMYVTAVPVTTEAEGTAILPRSGNGEAATRAAIRSTLMAMYPLTDVKVRLHAPYKMTSLTTMRGNWGLMLGEVNKLRIAEGNHGYYIGFIPHSPLGNTTTGNSFMPGTVATAMGAANPTAWRSGNVQHEIGHNFNLGHVACTPIGAAKRIRLRRGSWHDRAAGGAQQHDELLRSGLDQQGQLRRGPAQAHAIWPRQAGRDCHSAR
ncbi:hypothetical protein LP420_06030 [Massilia sp. B-10]|nr:hypothetical protein LP420_06030 [Massilia sp. B-10]